MFFTLNSNVISDVEDEDEAWYQYLCLNMSPQDGLDELEDLKCLRRLTLEKMSFGRGDA